MDILERLRRPSEVLEDESLGDLCRKAADEIERLRSLLWLTLACNMSDGLRHAVRSAINEQSADT